MKERHKNGEDDMKMAAYTGSRQLLSSYERFLAKA
jgi:hypothetical protein